MSDYQVIARKFRPQSFQDVVGQDAIVTTLKNAIKFNRLAQAYLFCGSRGTGKTTLARLFAKALNCQQPTSDFEPCNQCASCREITSGSSLDVMEIDGASNRGIEDIRQINDNVGYATVSGHYKIYIIDEVHMLTKEAFNALLKTLEEPPPKVKFFFATTEPHKVLSTILSRCQRFNLNRIPLPLIVAKLSRIAKQLNVTIDEEALQLLAQRAEGGLRDAESLFDQILAFEEGSITVASVAAILGLMPRDIYFEIDQAGKQGHFIKAFEIAQRVFSEGKDLTYFIEGLIDHLRQILLVKLAGPASPFMHLTDAEKEKYAQTARLYSQEQCLDLIEYLLEAQNQLRTTAFGKTFFETILLHVMRSHFRLPIEQLVRHLSELEHKLGDNPDGAYAASTASTPQMLPEASNAPEKQLAPPLLQSVQNPVTAAIPKATPVVVAPPPVAVSKPLQPPPQAVQPLVAKPSAHLSEDPTPSSADLGKAKKAAKPEQPPAPVSKPSVPIAPQSANEAANETPQRPVHAYDTLFHFAAIELEGKLQKN